MRQVFIGVALVIAGIAAFVEASSHVPRHCNPGVRYLPGPCHPTGLSQTAYDLLRIGGWALVLVGGALVVTGLIRYWQSGQRERSTP
jgi:hypothetical protein